MGLSFSTIDQNKKVNELLRQFELYKQSCALEIDILKNENKKLSSENNTIKEKFRRYKRAYDDMSKHNKLEIDEYKKELANYKKMIMTQQTNIKNMEKQLIETNLKLLKYNDVISKISSINTTIDGILE